MAVRIEVEKSGSNVVLRGPEHPLLVERAPALGGRAKGRDWTFPVAKEEQVRKLARELWGTDGKDGRTVTLRLDLSLYGEGPLGRIGEAWLAGRLIARRRAFDGPAELGEGVKLVSGAFGAWGGSPGRPALAARYGTTVDIADVPMAAAQQAEKDFPFEAKIVAGGDAQVGAWSRTVTEKRPGPAARAEAKLSGREPGKAAAPAASKKAAAAPAKPAAKASAPAKPAPAPKAAAKPAAKAAAKPAAKAAAKPAKAAAKPAKAAPAPKKAAKKTGKKKTAAAAPRKAAKKAARPAPRAAKKAARKATRRTAPARPAKKAAKKTAARRPAPKKTARRAAPARKKAARRGRR